MPTNKQWPRRRKNAVWVWGRKKREKNPICTESWWADGPKMGCLIQNLSRRPWSKQVFILYCIFIFVRQRDTNSASALPNICTSLNWSRSRCNAKVDQERIRNRVTIHAGLTSAARRIYNTFFFLELSPTSKKKTTHALWSISFTVEGPPVYDEESRKLGPI